MKKIPQKIILTFMIMIALIIAIQCKGVRALNKAKSTIRVGSKNFTENLIVGELYALALEDADYNVERIFNIPDSDIHNLIVEGKIDLYPGYTGTGLLSILKLELITDPQKVYDIVKSEYKKQFKLIWLNYSEVNDGFGIVIRTDVAKKLGIKTISDLQPHASKLRFVTHGEFEERKDGLARLEEVYGEFNLKPVKIKVYENKLKYNMLLSNEADFAVAYTTEPQLLNSELTLLEDDKKAWPPYNLAPIIRESVLNANPEIADILNKVSASLTTENIRELNASVDLGNKDYKAVAKEYYDSIK